MEKSVEMFSFTINYKSNTNPVAEIAAGSREDMLEQVSSLGKAHGDMSRVRADALMDIAGSTCTIEQAKAYLSGSSKGLCYRDVKGREMYASHHIATLHY